MYDSIVHELIGLLQADGLERLRQHHQPDASGRCISCRPGGDSTGAVPWPCTTGVALALAAKQMAEDAGVDQLRDDAPLRGGALESGVPRLRPGGHGLEVGPVRVRHDEQQEDSILAAIVDPGVADEFREHVRGHHDGRLPWH